MEATLEQATQRPKRKHGRIVLWLGLFVVLAGVGGRWFWRQVQFTQLRAPLIKAVKAGNTARVRSLLEQGADPEVRMDYKPEPWTWRNAWPLLLGRKRTEVARSATVLMYAAIFDHADIAQQLLEHGADVNRGYPNGALDHAAYSGSVGTMKVLLKHGARIELSDGFHFGTLGSAVEGDSCSKDNNYTGNTTLLLQHGATADLKNPKAAAMLLNRAAVYGNSDLLRLYLQRGVDVNSRDESGRTALMTAARSNRFHVLWLPERESGVSKHQDNQHTLGYTATEALLRAGAPVNAVDAEGRTALMHAIDLSGRDQRWVMEATYNGYYLAIARLLLRYGADVRLTDKHGQTALQIAEKLHEKEAVSLLRNAAARAPRAGKAGR